MKCKNCGNIIDDNTKRCPNCGAFCSKDGYILLTDDDALQQDYFDYEPPKKRRKLVSIIIMILIIIIAAGGVYYYLNIYTKPDNTPPLALTSGCGTINEDEQVVYVSIPENSRIEYIHGAALYDYDKTADTKNNSEPISTDYEYTKSVDEVFRTVFFDIGAYDLEKNNEYTYTIEFEVSFIDSKQRYTYTQPVTLNNEVNNDASDIVFDHSMIK